LILSTNFALQIPTHLFNLSEENRMFAKVLIKTVFVICLLALPAFAQTKLLRFPDIDGDRVVFSYASDLWISPASGRTAIRLTAHPGMEVFAKFSPDGRWIAFTGQYDGDEQVYVMPASGGEPKQLTFYPAKGPLTPRWGYDNQVMGWTNDGKSIVFRSQRDSYTLPISRLYTVPMTGRRARRACRCPKLGSGDFSPDGTKMIYRRAPEISVRKNATAAGQANTLYIYDLQTNDARKNSKAFAPRATRCGSAIKVFYNSDRDGKLISTFSMCRRAKRRKRQISKIGKCAGLRRTTKAHRL
jgi:tricorn protease